MVRTSEGEASLFPLCNIYSAGGFCSLFFYLPFFFFIIFIFIAASMPGFVCWARVGKRTECSSDERKIRTFQKYLTLRLIKKKFN